MLSLFSILNAIIKLTEFFERLHESVETDRKQKERVLLDKAIQHAKEAESTEELQKEVGKLL